MLYQLSYLGTPGRDWQNPHHSSPGDGTTSGARPLLYFFAVSATFCLYFPFSFGTLRSDDMDQSPTSSVSVPRERAPKVRPAAADPADDRPKLPPRRQQNPWIRRAVVFATCALVLNALFGERGLAESMRADRVYQQTAMDLVRMRQENAGLREQIRRLRDDPGTIESVARAELGLIKPGEILVVIKDLR